MNQAAISEPLPDVRHAQGRQQLGECQQQPRIQLTAKGLGEKSALQEQSPAPASGRDTISPAANLARTT